MGSWPSSAMQVHPHGEASKKHKKKPSKVENKKTGETFGADQALMEKINRKLKGKISRTNIHHHIVFCPITSRVGSDVEAAMDQVKSDQRIILVLMHHTRDPDYSTAGTNWSENIANVDLDVHVLFHESVPGLLKCSQNDKAVDQIVKFIMQNKNSKQDQPKIKNKKTDKKKEGIKSKERNKKRD